MCCQLTSNQCLVEQVFPHDMVDGCWITDRDVPSLQFCKLEASEVSSNVSALSHFPLRLSRLASSIESMLFQVAGEQCMFLKVYLQCGNIAIARHVIKCTFHTLVAFVSEWALSLSSEFALCLRDLMTSLTSGDSAGLPSQC